MLVFTRRVDWAIVQLFKNTYRAKDSEIVNNRVPANARVRTIVCQRGYYSFFGGILCCTVRLYLQRSAGIQWAVARVHVHERARDIDNVDTSIRRYVAPRAGRKERQVPSTGIKFVKSRRTFLAASVFVSQRAGKDIPIVSAIKKSRRGFK